MSRSPLAIALEVLRARGFAISGRFEPERGEQWCARRLLARIHGYSRDRRRAEVRPVSRAEWQQFLLSWWHAAPAGQLQAGAGRAGGMQRSQGLGGRAGGWGGWPPQRWPPS